MLQRLLTFKLCNVLDRSSDDQVLVHGQLTKAEQHLLGIGEAVVLDGTALLLQRQQLLRPRLGNHPLTPGHDGNLDDLDRLPVPAPTLERLETADGVVWRVSYAGMVRYHRQDWQAFTFYEMAKAMYWASGNRQ